MNKFKHDILLRIVKSINIVLITIPFAVCWFFYYADHVVSPFYSKGNWLVILLFLVFYITFGRIYDAFLISIYSVAEIMYSQILSAMLSDGVMYIVICLLSKGFPNLLPGILAIAGQLLLSVLWARGARRWYFRTFEPQPTAIIYDERRGISRLIEEHGLKNKYDVQYAVSVDECFKLDVERYVRVNFNAFKEGISAIGGIDIELTPAEAEYINNAARHDSSKEIQRVSAGQQHLNGTTALTYARIRKIDSDWKRIERQRTVIQAAINQVKNSDIFTLNALADAILPMVQTNLTKAEITRLILEVPAFLSEGSKMEQMTIPTYETCWNSVGVDGRKMIGVDFEANAQILREFFYGTHDGISE